MKNFRIRLSLRYKLLFLLTSLPAVSLALYLFMATNLFQKDKIAYVFDSSATVSRSIATQLRIEIQSLFGTLKPIVESYDFSNGRFSGIARNLFQKQDTVKGLVLFERSANGAYRHIGEMFKQPQLQAKFDADHKLIDGLMAQVRNQTAYLTANPQFPDSVATAFRVGGPSQQHQLIILSLCSSADLLSAFNGGSLYESYLIKKNGLIAIGPYGDLDTSLLKPYLNSAMPEGTGQVKTAGGMELLVSYATIGLGDLMIVSTVDKAKALKAVDVLVAKSLLFFIALIASTLIISVFASLKLTSTLRELFEATQKIAQGDFNVTVPVRSRDEVGGLAESFTYMASEVSRLMSETAQKARMENELATVKTVQETLFPPSEAAFDAFKVEGHFEPASECGGDWWNYSRVGDKLFLWIGDATGHGAPAALITSAARSAAAVVESLPDMTPSKALQVLNYAIHQTSKGRIMMTFFLGCLDLKSGLLTYCNASHDPPYLMRAKEGQPLKKRDLVPLMDVNGSRLGEKPDSRYQEAKVQLERGDLLFFYTDGIADVQDPAGQKWGERNFLKNLLDSANSGETIHEKLNDLRTKISSYRQGAELLDDVTVLMCEYESDAKKAA